MNKNDISDASQSLSSVALWPKRIGLGLLAGALLCFLWPSITGETQIAGYGNVVIGRVLLIAAWVPLVIGIIQRARFQRKQSGED
jgi:hypothetical protein